MEEKCYICGGSADFALLHYYKGIKIHLCERHAEEYKGDTPPDAFVNDHEKRIEDMVRSWHFEKFSKLISIAELNSQHILNVCERFNDGLFTDRETCLKILMLSEEIHHIFKERIDGE